GAAWASPGTSGTARTRTPPRSPSPSSTAGKAAAWAPSSWPGCPNEPARRASGGSRPRSRPTTRPGPGGGGTWGMTWSAGSSARSSTRWHWPACRSAGRAELEAGPVGLLRAAGLGGGAQGAQLGFGQVTLDDAAHSLPADLGLDAQVDAGDAVLAVHPGADRQDRAGVLRDGA